MVALVVVLALSFGAGCDGATNGGDAAGQGPPPPRAGRYGSLRDLVLTERTEGGPFFLDRFEATRADWAEFAASPEGAAAGAPQPPQGPPGDEVLPMANVDLAQARAFARWRFCRLPRSDEWEHAATAGGRALYPWGDRADAARANTGELGIGETLPVGTFESGRQRDGGAYDLVGNVAEWTETVPFAWFGEEFVDFDGPERMFLPRFVGMERAAELLGRMPALGVWRVQGAPLPAFWFVAVLGPRVPREVVGAHFASSMADVHDRRYREWALPDERSSTIGVRVCTTPVELLQALAAEPHAPDPVSAEQLRRFVARGRHAAVLRQALAELPERDALPPTPSAELLRRLLAEQAR